MDLLPTDPDGSRDRPPARLSGWRSGWVPRGLAALAGLALPVDCAGCGRPDHGLCPTCRALLAPAPGGRPVLPSPLPVPAFAALDYGGVAARVMVAWKDHGRHDLVRPLGAALAAALGALLAHPDGARPGELRPGQPRPGGVRPGGTRPVLVVPVPSARRARRRRGEDTVRRLALVAAARLRSGPVPGGSARVSVRVTPALHLVRRVGDQAELSATARRENVAGAFAVRPAALSAVRGQVCAVVDDVLTTGATLGEAVRALEAAGAQVAGVATVCVTRLRRACDAPPKGVPVQVTKH